MKDNRRRDGAIVALIVEAPYENLIDLRERAKTEVSKVVIGQERRSSSCSSRRSRAGTC